MAPLYLRRVAAGRDNTDDERVCVVCGASLKGRRSDARHCSGACRAEASRLRAMLRGAEQADFDSIARRMARRRRRRELS